MSIWDGRPVLEYLCTRNTDQLHKLYSSPAVSFAVFRLLPELAQQFILKALWLDGKVKKWCVLSKYSKNILPLPAVASF